MILNNVNKPIIKKITSNDFRKKLIPSKDLTKEFLYLAPEERNKLISTLGDLYVKNYEKTNDDHLKNLNKFVASARGNSGNLQTFLKSYPIWSFVPKDKNVPTSLEIALRKSRPNWPLIEKLLQAYDDAGEKETILNLEKDSKIRSLLIENHNKLFKFFAGFDRKPALFSWLQKLFCYVTPLKHSNELARKLKPFPELQKIFGFLINTP